jgi:D-erythro-7,8-dihydroneopterin triphosphate epimerase
VKPSAPGKTSLSIRSRVKGRSNPHEPEAVGLFRNSMIAANPQIMLCETYKYCTVIFVERNKLLAICTFFGDLSMSRKWNQAGPTPLFDRATINIRNLRLRTFIGFNDEERAKKQDVVLNLEISYLTHPAVFNDEVEDALNYKTITKAVIRQVEEGRFLLLEKLAADVLATCSSHAAVTHARVTIDKPHALRFADSVSLTLEYDPNAQNTLNLLEKAS